MTFFSNSQLGLSSYLRLNLKKSWILIFECWGLVFAKNVWLLTSKRYGSPLCDLRFKSYDLIVFTTLYCALHIGQKHVWFCLVSKLYFLKLRLTVQLSKSNFQIYCQIIKSLRFIKKVWKSENYFFSFPIFFVEKWSCKSNQTTQEISIRKIET